MNGVVVQVNISDGGVPKRAVLMGRVGVQGIEGDRQRNTKHHGGPAKAICLYSEELYAWLRGQGMPVENGAVGENLTLRGIDLGALRTGDRLEAGEVELEITTVRIPCATLEVWHERLPEVMQGHSGWYARVIRGGEVRPGTGVRVRSAEARP